MGNRQQFGALVAAALLFGSVAAHAQQAEPPAGGGARIVWDRTGVPHIYSKSETAGMRAFGWAQMEAHGDRILQLYGRARGRAAEYWGAPYVQADELTRRLGFPGLSQEWARSLPREDAAKLEAFVAGMNAYARAHPDRLAPELRAVLPIQRTDPLAHLYQVIHLAFTSSGDVAVAKGLAKPAGEARPGSNAYAIGPSRSASGNAMLVINPHLPWGDLFTWFEAQLSIPSHTIYGVALAGTPFVGIGFGEQGGWTHTVNHYDGSDLYALTLRDGGYLLDGQRRDFGERAESYRVRRADGTLETRRLVIRTSVHGPVIAEGEGKAYALRIASLRPFGMLRQYWDMAAAADVDAFEQAQKRLQMPFFNTFYAGRSGDIYYLHGGALPDRRVGDHDFWGGVIPGDRSAFLWEGTRGYEALPHFRNPPAGFIQNANEPPWTTTSPSVLSPGDYAPFVAPREGMGFRPQHSMRQILADTSITFDELVEMKQSTRLELADRILPDLLAAAASSDDADIRAAGEVLAAWDRRTDAGSEGAMLFIAWAEAFLEQGKQAFATRWRPDQPVTTPAGIADPAAATALLKSAAAATVARYGSLKAPYGAGHRLRIGGKDLPASGGPGELGAYRNAYGTPDASGVATIEGGDSFVAVVEFGPRLRAVGILPYGASSQPGSPHLGDQQSLFSEGQLRPIWFYPDEVSANAVRSQDFRRP